MFDPDNYVRATRAQTAAALKEPRIVVSLQRAAFRDHHSPSYGADFVAIPEPRIMGVRVELTPDQWGNRLFGDVEYNHYGHRATYGGRVENGRVIWQCYMD